MLRLFPSARGLEVTWHSIVKIGQSLYNEGPGMDPFRPDQQTPVHRMFLAGSYTKQDYIDSMCAPPPLLSWRASHPQDHSGNACELLCVFH